MTVRRFKDLIRAYSEEYEVQCKADQSLVRMAAGLTLKAEEMQAALVRGEHVSNDESLPHPPRPEAPGAGHRTARSLHSRISGPTITNMTSPNSKMESSHDELQTGNAHSPVRLRNVKGWRALRRLTATGTNFETVASLACVEVGLQRTPILADDKSGLHGRPGDAVGSMDTSGESAGH